MGHKAGREFFDAKRAWSERKDRILTEYLREYVPTVALGLHRPVCIVDGFAGPGQFRDGKPGSPTIVRDVLAKAVLRRGVRACALFVERDAELCAELRGRMVATPWVEIREGRFLDQVPEIERVAKTHTIFMYLDPYTVAGLEWAALDRVFRMLDGGTSVEILLNFNADSFARWGLSALALHSVIPADDPEDPDSAPPSSDDAATLVRLDTVVHGDWWRVALREPRPYPERVRAVVDGFCDQLRTRFAEVCVHEIQATATARVPKYALVFGSRTPVALRLMNDAMASSREMLAKASDPGPGILFETRPESVVPDASRLRSLVTEEAAVRRPRIALVEAVARRSIGSWRCAEIRGEIERGLREGRLRSATGALRINDGVDVWRA